MLELILEAFDDGCISTTITERDEDMTYIAVLTHIMICKEF